LEDGIPSQYRKEREKENYIRKRRLLGIKINEKRQFVFLFTPALGADPPPWPEKRSRD
jgi:hypothetical protein